MKTFIFFSSIECNSMHKIDKNQRIHNSKYVQTWAPQSRLSLVHMLLLKSIIFHFHEYLIFTEFPDYWVKNLGYFNTSICTMKVSIGVPRSVHMQ